ncbi:MAG: c-type cytochrome [Nitrospiria bacterium]
MKKNLKLIVALLFGMVLVVGFAYSIIFQDPHVVEGRHLYYRYCSACHGESGMGNGYNARNLDPHPRDLTDKSETYMAKLGNQEIYDVISKGGRGVELSALMPSFGKVFSEKEIWSIVAYVRTLHKHKDENVQFPPTLQAARVRLPAVTEAEFDRVYQAEVTSPEKKEELIAAGRENFSGYGCIGCHRVQNEGGQLGPNLTRVGFMLQPQFIYRWVRNPQSILPNTRMPNLGLSDKDALSIVLYFETLNGPPDTGKKAQASNPQPPAGVLSK